MKSARQYKRMTLIVAVLMSLACGVTALASDTARLGVIVGDRVNIRGEASSEGDVIGRYSQDTRIVIVGSKGSYFQVEYNGQTGYVSDEFAIAYDYEKGKINASYVNLREGPNTDSDVITTLGKGDAVYIYGTSGDFYRVTCGNNAGYVSKEFVSTGSSSSSSSGSSSSSSSSSRSSDSSDSSKSEESSKSYSRSVKTDSFTDAELYLVAQLIYCEGKGSGSTSYRALASVVYNRYASKKFPDTIEGVVFQDGQFTVVNNREKFLATKPDRKSQDAVHTVFVEGQLSLPSDILFFKSDRLSRDWGSSREYYATIGGNMYYS